MYTTVNGQNIGRHILKEYSTRCYQTRMLTKSQIRRLLGFATRYKLDVFLTARQVPRDYTLQDLQQDRYTARWEKMQSRSHQPAA